MVIVAVGWNPSTAANSAAKKRTLSTSVSQTNASPALLPKAMEPGWPPKTLRPANATPLPRNARAIRSGACNLAVSRAAHLAGINVSPVTGLTSAMLRSNT